MSRVGPRAATATTGALSHAFFQLMLKRVVWYQGVAGEFGLSPVQAKTLGLMDPARPSTMSEVAQIAGCGLSNLTGIVDKLEARRLVRRSAAAGDRRSKVLSVTPAGAAMRARLATRLSEPAPWMCALSAAEQRRLAVLLRKGLALARATADGAAAPAGARVSGGRRRARPARSGRGRSR